MKRIANLMLMASLGLTATGLSGEDGDTKLVAEGDQAPTFFLRLYDGSSFYLSKTVGPKARGDNKKPVVLSFFATWCIPCKKEIPQLHILQDQYPDVGIYLVDVNEPVDLLGGYIEEFEISLQVLMDRYGKVATKYGVVDVKGVGNLPTLFIIDADGEVKYAHVGYKEGDEKHYAKLLKEITGH